jgi:hypothetical protein
MEEFVPVSPKRLRYILDAGRASLNPLSSALIGTTAISCRFNNYMGVLTCEL